MICSNYGSEAIDHRIAHAHYDLGVETRQGGRIDGVKLGLDKALVHQIRVA